MRFFLSCNLRLVAAKTRRDSHDRNIRGNRVAAICVFSDATRSTHCCMGGLDLPFDSSAAGNVQLER